MGSLVRPAALVYYPRPSARQGAALRLKAGQVEPATVADHIEPLGGDWNKFRTSALQSLCGPCHKEKHGRLSPTSRLSKEVDDNGYPVDPAHPFNKVRPARG
jgi:hypothetical protein